MGQRLLSITVDLLTNILGGFRDGPPHYFHVTRNAIPADAKIVSVQQSPYWPDTVDVILESVEWDEAPPRTQVVPVLTAFVVDANQVV